MSGMFDNGAYAAVLQRMKQGGSELVGIDLGGKHVSFVAGVIRNTGNGWALIADGDHSPMRITGVTTNANGTITISHEVEGTHVGTLLVVPDETYAKIGLVAGASVGIDYSVINLAAPLDFYVNGDTREVTAPAHFGTRITAEYVADGIKINHPEIPLNSALMFSRSGKTGKTDVEASVSPGQTASYFYPKARLYGYVYYTGAAWAVSDSNAPAAIAPVWNGNHLEITHPSGYGADIHLNGRFPCVTFNGAFGDAMTEVYFTDKVGADKTVPDASMRFYFDRGNLNCIEGGSVKIPLGTWGFSASCAPVHAADLANPGGNLWIIGVVERRPA